MTHFSVLSISQSYKIKLEGKFELGTQVNKIVKDFTKKMTAPGGPLQLLNLGSGAPYIHTLLKDAKPEEYEKAAREHPNEEPLLKEFLNADGEKLHLYGVHGGNGGKNYDDDIEHSNIVVRKKRRRRNGLILII